MSTAITLKDITIYPVVEQQGPFFDVWNSFRRSPKSVLEENRSWLRADIHRSGHGRLVLCVQASS